MKQLPLGLQESILLEAFCSSFFSHTCTVTFTAATELPCYWLNSCRDLSLHLCCLQNWRSTLELKKVMVSFLLLHVTTNVKPAERTFYFCFRYENCEDQQTPRLKLLTGEVRDLDKRWSCNQFFAAAKMSQWRELNSTIFLSAATEHIRNWLTLPTVRGVVISNYKPSVRYRKLRDGDAKPGLGRIHLQKSQEQYLELLCRLSYYSASTVQWSASAIFTAVSVLHRVILRFPQYIQVCK